MFLCEDTGQAQRKFKICGYIRQNHKFLIFLPFILEDSKSKGPVMSYAWGVYFLFNGQILVHSSLPPSFFFRRKILKNIMYFCLLALFSSLSGIIIRNSFVGFSEPGRPCTEWIRRYPPDLSPAFSCRQLLPLNSASYSCVSDFSLCVTILPPLSLSAYRKNVFKGNIIICKKFPLRHCLRGFVNIQGQNRTLLPIGEAAPRTPAESRHAGSGSIKTMCQGSSGDNYRIHSMSASGDAHLTGIETYLRIVACTGRAIMGHKG